MEGSEYESQGEEDEEQDPVASLVQSVMQGEAEDGEATLETEVRHLAGTDPTPIDEATVGGMQGVELERFLHQEATQAAQQLLRQLWALPVERTSTGPVAELPLPKLILPREKPIPAEKPKTRWEKFAEAKGIDKNKKRGRMVWDEVEEKWAPRYGYKRANNEDELGIQEVKAGDDPYADPWTAKRQEKRARVAKNETNRERNQLRARGGAPASAPRAGIPVDLEGSEKRGKARTKTALGLAQHSTASMGKFDPERLGEPKMQSQSGARKNVPSNDMTKTGLKDESSRNTKLLTQVLSAASRAKQAKGAKGEREEARKQSREYHPLDDAPYSNMGGGDAGEYKKKKGRAGAGKMKKMTKKRSK